MAEDTEKSGGARQNYELPDITREEKRFEEIVKGRIKKDFAKYISKPGVFVPGRGKKTYRITIPHIDLPKFRYGGGKGGGVGQGDGDVGDPVAPGDEGDQPGEGDQAGDKPGEHGIDVEFSLEELLEMMSDEWELPNIKPKGKRLVESDKFTYHGLRRVGPKALLSRRRTFKEAYFRSIASGHFRPGEKMDFYPIKKDRRYRSWTYEPEPVENALIFFMRDYSGSMTEEKTQLLRTTDWIVDLWLTAHYKGVERVYIVHDTDAKVVTEEEYYGTSTGGGTMISSGYGKIAELIETEYNPHEWNVYIFQGTDGENWGGDSEECVKILEERIMEHLNMLAINIVKPSNYGWGSWATFKTDMEKVYGTDHEVVRTAETSGEDDISGTIKRFLGTKDKKKK